MKNRSLIYLGFVAIFAYLFYDQSIGVNFLIFPILVLLVMIYLGFKKKYLVPFIGLICTGFGVFMYDETPAIAIHFLSVIILFGFLTDRIKSLYLASIMGGISGFLSLITKTVDLFSNSNTVFSQLRFNRSNAFSIIIALLVTLIFGSIYASANPLFSDLLTFVTFTNYQINWELIMVILGGSIMMAAVFYPFRVEFVKTIEEKMPSVLSAIQTEIEDSEFLNALKTENKSGIIMLSMLNILILFFNLFDVINLTRGIVLPNGMTYSQYVHEGVNLLIISVILAIGVILFFFRGNLNFYSGNQLLKKLAFAWLIQNTLLLLLVAQKNTSYIGAYGLTYKRIGVYVFLLLTMAGIALTFIKIIRQKTIWYLLRTGSTTAYLTLCVFVVFNWDAIILRYNLNYAHVQDKNYNESLNLVNTWHVWRENNLPEPDYKVYRKNQSDWQSFHLGLYRYENR